MFKRANKITALLVAAASIMSVVPAMAADSTRLGTKEGTINKAIAYDGGKYIYDGYRTDDDNTGIYYNSGDKDKMIEDLDDYELENASKYGSKYAYATKSGEDDYLIDLSSGKTSDDETAEEKMDTAKSKLKSALKKTDRYAETDSWSDIDVTRILGGQFGDIWYQYKAMGDKNTAATTGDAAVLTIELPSAAKIAYDTEKNGKCEVKVADTTYATTGDAAKVTIFTANSDLYTKVEAQIKADSLLSKFTTVSHVGSNLVAKTPVSTVIDTTAISKKYGSSTITNGTLTGDNLKYTGFVNDAGKYIDASNLANIYVYSTKAEKVVKVEEFNDYNTDNAVQVDLTNLEAIAQDKDNLYVIATVNIINGAKGSTPTRTGVKFLQKISKSQGDKKDDAYVPKNVTSYEMDTKLAYDDGDVQDAFNDVFTDRDGYKVEDNQYRVMNDTLYVTRVKEGTVAVYREKMKKMKLDPMSGTTLDNSKKLDAYVVIRDGDADHDIVKNSDDYRLPVSIDADGNTWGLDKGSIFKFDGKDFKEKFTCDRSLDALDVYNEGSIVAYEKSGDVYTTVQEGTKVTEGEGAAVVTPAKVGWDKLADGTWNFYDATGAKVVNNWANVGGVWYYMKADGVMATGWAQVGGTWYFLNANGSMATGWVNQSGTWYFLQSSGAMKTGWLNDNGTWYYLNANGSMAANTTVDGYVLNGSGAWVK